MIIILKGKLQSTNNIYRAVCRGRFPCVYMSANGKALKEDYQWQIKQQMNGQRMFTEPIRVSIILYHGTKRKCDWDNFHKLSMDAMSKLVYKDDSLIQYATVTKNYSKENPRIEIEILPLSKSSFNSSI